MKPDIKIIRFVKKLVELCKEEGIVVDSRVSEVLATLRQKQPRHHLLILRTFLSYIRREVAAQTAVVSSPSTPGDAALKLIEAQFTRQYGRRITAVVRKDDSLIAGIRVSVGDDVYDASVSGRLRKLAESVR